AWLQANRENPRRRQRIETSLTALLAAPRFSILVPVYNPPIEALQAMFSGVIAQSFAGWELIVVDDASPDIRIWREIERWSQRDNRIRSIRRQANGNISAATNQAADAARGEFFVFLDHDDLLDRDALTHLALHIDANAETDLVYSDDDKIDAH